MKIDYSKVWDGVDSPDNETVGRIISCKITKKEMAEVTVKVGEACLKHENDDTCFPLIQTLLIELTRYIGDVTPTRRDALMMLAGYTAGHFDEATLEASEEMVKAIEEAKELLNTLNGEKQWLD